MPAPIVLSYLYAALAEPFGLAIATPDLPRLRTALHAAKRGACDPALDGIILRSSVHNPHGELWIINSSPALGAALTPQPASHVGPPSSPEGVLPADELTFSTLDGSVEGPREGEG